MLCDTGEAYDTYISSARKPEVVGVKPVRLAACLSDVAALRELIAKAMAAVESHRPKLPDLRAIYKPPAERRPEEGGGATTDASILQVWASCAIDALTVHVVSAKKVNVSIPLNWKMCEQAYEDGHYGKGSWPEKYSKDCNYLADLLVRATLSLLDAATARGRLKYSVRRHKKREYKKDDMEFVVAQCRSDRPAFVLHEPENPDVHELYLYNAMGLQRQHKWQQVLLGRCESFAAAAALIRATTKHLGPVHYRADRVRFWADSTGLQADWAAACASAGLTGPPESRKTLSDAFVNLPPEARAQAHALLVETAQANNFEGLEPFLSALEVV